MSNLSAAISSGLLIIVGVVTAALINELHGGWVWWLLAGLAALIWAAGTGLLYLHDDGRNDVRVSGGGVYAGGRIGDSVETRTRLHEHDYETAHEQGPGVDVGPGAVFSEADIGGSVRTDTIVSPGGQTTSDVDSEDEAPNGEASG